MPQYLVEITTTVISNRQITIEAKNKAEAFEKAEDECLTYYEDETQIEEVNDVEEL